MAATSSKAVSGFDAELERFRAETGNKSATILNFGNKALASLALKFPEAAHELLRRVQNGSRFAIKEATAIGLIKPDVAAQSEPDVTMTAPDLTPEEALEALTKVASKKAA